MSSALDPRQSHRTADAGLPTTGATRAESHAAHYIDAQGVVTRADGDTGYRDLVRHYRKRPIPKGIGWLLAVVLAWAAVVAFAAAVYEILVRVWP